jgi:hypothetical protein
VYRDKRLVEFYVYDRLQLIRAVSSTSPKKKNVIACTSFLDVYSVLKKENKTKRSNNFGFRTDQSPIFLSLHIEYLMQHRRHRKQRVQQLLNAS